MNTRYLCFYLGEGKTEWLCSSCGRRRVTCGRAHDGVVGVVLVCDLCGGSTACNVVGPRDFVRYAAQYAYALEYPQTELDASCELCWKRYYRLDMMYRDCERKSDAVACLCGQWVVRDVSATLHVPCDDAERLPDCLEWRLSNGLVVRLDYFGFFSIVSPVFFPGLCDLPCLAWSVPAPCISQRFYWDSRCFSSRVLPAVLSYSKPCA